MTDSLKEFTWGVGRRKTAVARVRLKAGTGQILVNGRPFDTFFPLEPERANVHGPLLAAQCAEKYDVWANVNGGGPSGQAGAMRLGIARALMKVDPALEPLLRDGNFLTRDSRMVERKKYGQRKARRRFQFSKR
jgi:small subunit ribosomal protein S9